MKLKLRLFAALSLGALLVAFFTGAALPEQAAFEYRIIQYTNRNEEKALNEDGQQGWELVAVTTRADTPATFYLKRRIR